MSLEFQVTFDCHDADLLADFWSIALERVVQAAPPGFDSWPAFLEAQGMEVPPPGSMSAIVDPDGDGPRILFQRVPEDKEVKNRVHLDVRAGEGRDAKVDELTAAGGTVIRAVAEAGLEWTVMADPEGNEFCVTAS